MNVFRMEFVVWDRGGDREGGDCNKRISHVLLDYQWRRYIESGKKGGHTYKTQIVEGIKIKFT